MSWSRILDTQLAAKARQRYAEPARHYHDWAHVQRLYWHAEHTLGLAYDDQLDRAILAHDVIYDAGGQNEIRSAEWLLAHDPDATDVAHAHVMRTERHCLGGDHRIVLLDLADLGCPELVLPNRELLFKEAQAMHGMNRAAFAKANKTFFEGLRSSISGRTDIEPGSPEDRLVDSILVGIDLVILACEEDLAAWG